MSSEPVDQDPGQIQRARNHMDYLEALYRFHQKTVLLSWLFCLPPAYLSYGTNAHGILMSFFGFYGSSVEAEMVIVTKLLVAIIVFAIMYLLLWPLREHLKEISGPTPEQFGLEPGCRGLDGPGLK